MHTLEFTLRQHTPIIHFQHDQDGATLRASELKPKLDRFIIERKGGWNQIPDSWKVGRGKGVEEQHALDYKVRISITPKSTLRWYLNKEVKWTWPCFFANKGKYKLCCVDGSLNLSIKTEDHSLAEKITSSVCSFFSNNTFASRQSKGFGAFFPLPSSPAFQANSYYKPAVKKYSFDVDVSSQTDFWNNKKRVFEHIDLFYRLLRSGINRKTEPLFVSKDLNGDGQNEWLNERGTKFYCKPVLFLYLKEKGIQWDKKTMKQQFFNDDYYSRNPDRKEQEFLRQQGYPNVPKVYDRGLPQQKIKYPNSDILTYAQIDSEFKLWRDLMGLSSLEEWKSYGMVVAKEHAKLNGKKWVARPEDDLQKIHRFKSPFGFLPIFADDNRTCTVYFSSESIPKSYRDSHFIVSKREKHSHSLSSKKSEAPLQIGDLESLDPLIEWLLTPGKFSLTSNWLGDKNPEFEALTHVLSTLQRVLYV